ncbi:MATE family efflux transporter [Fervidibacillus halotolerans]|uniref:Probable multidrug resistance protein NorM n=1 Tax=Fervidibacillus halotolerans TaxID=2980027 RepID=A0A9E8RZF6_9BACI|nr:MATE family efflux transporter [Fervidibacillus halotolerans]WAA13293.1 MATE family efflux transporter [Fervidibacillus halotolerans]
MHKTNRLKEKTRMFFIIFIPIFITQIGLSLVQFFDTSMSGQVSSKDLAGVAIAGSLWSPIYTGLNGILIATTPIVSSLLGGNKKEEIRISVIQAIYVAIVIVMGILLIGVFSLKPLLQVMNLDQEVQRIAYYYLICLSFGIFPLFIYNVLRSFIDGLGQTKTTMFVTLLSVPINVFFNYLFIYGKFGFPKLGGIGAGIASAITYWIVLLITILIVIKHRPFSQYHLFSQFYSIQWEKWKEIFKIGIPIGLSIFFEVSIFSVITILMSHFDTITIASYQAAVNFTSILYMFPLSVSMALTILVAYETGSGRFKDAKQYSWLGVGLAVGMAAVNAFLLYIFKYDIAGLYTKEEEVLQLTATFLMFALAFQFSDGIQASVQGALRGYKDVNITFVTTLVAYWVIGLPLGALLANSTSLGPFGYWIGLIAGLTAGAIGLASRLVYTQKKLFYKVEKE